MNSNFNLRLLRFAFIGLALVSSGSLASGQVSDLPINTFDSATQGGIGSEWGPGSAAWDGVNGNPAGAMAVTCVFTGSSDTPMVAWTCLGQWANPWYAQTPINFSQYRSLQFDIKYDPTSDITVDQFNDLSTWPANLTNSAGQTVFQPWATASTLVGDGFIRGIEITLCGGPGGQMAPTIAVTNIPAAAATGWAHVIIPINAALGNQDGVSGFVFHKWCKQTWALQNPATAKFWIDNIWLEGTNAPPPPPTMSLTRAAPGLNLFAGSSSDTQNRYNIRTIQTTTGANYSWVGNGSTPVSYSFTISQYPAADHPYFMINQYFVPVPYDRVAGTNGTVGTGSAPDWDEPTCIFMDLENYNDGSGDWRFRYKTNSPGGNGTYYSDVLAEVRDPAGLAGTWTITFVNNTNVTMTTPSGLTTNFIFSADKVSWFADNAGVALPMYHYVGARANGAANYGLNAILSRVQIQGAPATLDDNFLADESLDATLWELASLSAASIQLLPTSANPAFWVNWTLPDNGFGLQSSSSLTGGWNDSVAPRLTLVPGKKVLINASDLPSSTHGYFRLVKRVASRLQVLLPGETSAPGTLTGKTGTPDTTLAISGNSQAAVTVNLCDETWHILASATDRVHLTCTDLGAWVSDDVALVGGTGTLYVNFYTPGTYTVTGSDVSNPAIAPDTSSSVTVGP